LFVDEYLITWLFDLDHHILLSEGWWIYNTII